MAKRATDLRQAMLQGARTGAQSDSAAAEPPEQAASRPGPAGTGKPISPATSRLP